MAAEQVASMPRDRPAPFETEMIKPFQRATDGLEYLIQALYPQGLALSETSEHLMGNSSTDLSREPMRKLTAKLAKEAEELGSWALPECVVIIMDGAYVPLKRNYSADRLN